MRYTVTRKLRPIRLGVFVPPDDVDAVIRAISLNSFLWGGYMNPIIPLHTEVPSDWGANYTPANSITSVISGYLDAFDPDFVTIINDSLDRSIDVGNRKIIDASLILQYFDDTSECAYGIGFYQILAEFLHEEMRFVRLNPIQIAVPTYDGIHKAFLAAMVGLLPEETAEHLQYYVKEGIISNENRDIRSIWQFVDDHVITPRRLCTRYLHDSESANMWNRHRVLYLDAENTGDILDYWNLRALGFRVVPFPKQAIDCDLAWEKVIRFVVESHGVARGNKEIIYNATIMRARSIAKGEFEDFAKDLQKRSQCVKSSVACIVQDWYPPIWDEFSRKNNFHDRVSQFSHVQGVEITSHDDHLNFIPLCPRFMKGFGLRPRVANELYFQTFSESSPTVEVFPEGGKALTDALGIGDYFADEWRFSSDGLVHFVGSANSTISLPLPKPQKLYESWLKTQGWQVNTSSAGLAIGQLLKQLGGKYGVSFLRNRNMIGLLNRMSNGKALANQSIRSEIGKIANSYRWANSDGLLDKLIKSRLIELGIEVQCPYCRRHPWFRLADFDQNVRCSECLAEFILPTYNVANLKWAYRATGPLMSLATVSGGFGVILAYRFFHNQLNWRLTPAFGSTLQRDADEFEIDFGCFLQTADFGSSSTHLVFAECKSFNTFETRDIERICALGAAHPGAVLVLSTLRDELSAEEISELSQAIQACRKYWKSDCCVNEVLILTGNELFAHDEVQLNWESIGGRHKSYAGYLSGRVTLHALADATQQLYLGLEPIHSSWQRDFNLQSANEQNAG